MPLTFLAPVADLTLAADVAKAQAAADNARQMVLNRDPQLEAVTRDYFTLAATAATVQGLAAASEQDRANLHAQVDALTATLAGRRLTVGEAKTTSLLALGTSVDLTVTLAKPMPSEVYDTAVLRTSVGIQLGNADLTVKAQTKTTVTVTVRAIVAVAAGATLTVLAWT